MPTTFGEVKWQKRRERNNMANESDWKLFRKRLPEWQERHMQSLLDEYAAIIAGDGDAAAKFWELEKRLKMDVRHVGVHAEMSRSRMVLNLMCLLHEKAITMSDLDGFSDEVKAAMPLTKQAPALAKTNAPGDRDYKDLLADELIGKYGES